MPFKNIIKSQQTKANTLREGHQTLIKNAWHFKYLFNLVVELSLVEGLLGLLGKLAGRSQGLGRHFYLLDIWK